MEPKGKPELLETNRLARASLEDTPASVRHERTARAGVMPGWSVRHLLAHLSAWQRRVAEWLAQALKGEIPQQLHPGMKWVDLDRWNQETYQDCRGLRSDQVFSESRASHLAALQATEQASRAELMDPGPYPWREGKPLWHMVAPNIFWHYQDHTETIAAWLGQAG